MRRGFLAITATLLPAAAGLGAGTLIAWLGGWLYVLGLFGLGVGLVTGGVAVFAARLTPEAPPWAPRTGAWVGVLLALGALLVFEDAHQRRAFAADLARSRAADSGLPPAEAARAFDEDPDAAVAFLARDADLRLDEEALRLTGQDGGFGRFLVRQDGGLRLVAIGPTIHGLPLGRAGGVGTYLVELLVCALVLRRVWGADRRST